MADPDGAVRLAILYGPSAANDWIVASLAHDRTTLLVREESPTWTPVARVLRRESRSWPVKLDQLAFLSWYAARHHRSVGQALRRRLGAAAPQLNRCVASIDCALNDIRDWKPDLILLLGTSILSAEWDELHVPIVNVHTGITPEYRGRFCWLWPVLEGRTEELGVTLHLISRRVDAGDIVLQRRINHHELPSRSFADLIEAVTRLSLTLCEQLLEDPSPLIANAKPAVEHSRRAYLEPGLTDYLRAFGRISNG